MVIDWLFNKIEKDAGKDGVSTMLCARNSSGTPLMVTLAGDIDRSFYYLIWQRKILPYVTANISLKGKKILKEKDKKSGMNSLHIAAYQIHKHNIQTNENGRVKFLVDILKVPQFRAIFAEKAKNGMSAYQFLSWSGKQKDITVETLIDQAGIEGAAAEAIRKVASEKIAGRTLSSPEEEGGEAAPAAPQNESAFEAFVENLFLIEHIVSRNK